MRGWDARNSTSLATLPPLCTCSLHPPCCAFPLIDLSGTWCPASSSSVAHDVASVKTSALASSTCACTALDCCSAYNTNHTWCVGSTCALYKGQGGMHYADALLGC